MSLEELLAKFTSILPTRYARSPALTEILARVGVYQLLGEMHKTVGAIDAPLFQHMWKRAGVRDRSVKALFSSGLLYTTPGTVRFTTFGQRTTLLVRAQTL